MKILKEGLTPETLPKAFEFLAHEVGEIKRLLLEKRNEPTPEPDRWFDLAEICQYLPDRPTKATVYSWVGAGIIPVYKVGKELRFLKSEVDEWLRQRKKKTLAETSREAESYFKTKRSSMVIRSNSRNNSLDLQQFNYKHFEGQKKRVFAAFKRNPSTMLMVSIETGILRANICRYVAELRKESRIQLLKQGLCPITKHRAGFYTTNPDLFDSKVEPSNPVKP